MKKPHILLSPLDWGLGHAARSCLIVDQLLKQNFEVSVAANQQGLELFEEHFHDQIGYIEELPDYNIHYQGKSLALSLARQFPAIRKVIREERDWLAKNAGKLNLSGVISDNRFGFYHADLPSVYITHQLNVKAYGFEQLSARIHASVIQNFDQCWIPDSKTNPLAKALSSPKVRRTNYEYISWLNRLSLADELPYGDELKVLVLSSGPEPYRSDFIHKAYESLVELEGNHLILGAKANASPQGKSAHIKYLNHAKPAALKGMIKKAEIILCRPGYTGLMELGAYGKKLIIVPSPGQTEQEYLGKSLHKSERAVMISNKKLNQLRLLKALETEHSFVLEKEQVDWEKLFRLFKPSSS